MPGSGNNTPLTTRLASSRAMPDEGNAFNVAAYLDRSVADYIAGVGAHQCTPAEVNERLPRYLRALANVEITDGIPFAYSDTTGVLDIQLEGSEHFGLDGYSTNANVNGDVARVKEAVQYAWEVRVHSTPVVTTVPVYDRRRQRVVTDCVLVVHWRHETDSLYMAYLSNRSG